MTVWELIAPGVLPALVAIVALVVSGRARVDERLDRINTAITDLAQRVARIEGRLDISNEREA